jgi:hypothetical protein
MRYRKKAVECDLILFAGFGDPLPAGVEVRINQGRSEVWNELHQSWIGLVAGDFINVSTPGDVYPIKADVVAASYERIAE